MVHVEVIIVSVIGAISSLLTAFCIAFRNSRIEHVRLANCISVNQDSDKSSVVVAIGSLELAEARKKELRRSMTL
jgi:hypothetical protein